MRSGGLQPRSGMQPLSSRVGRLPFAAAEYRCSREARAKERDADRLGNAERRASELMKKCRQMTEWKRWKCACQRRRAKPHGQCSNCCEAKKFVHDLCPFQGWETGVPDIRLHLLELTKQETSQKLTFFKYSWLGRFSLHLGAKSVSLGYRVLRLIVADWFGRLFRRSD